MFWPSTPLYHFVPSPPPLSDTRRPPTHIYTWLDYNAYIQSRIRLFSYHPFMYQALRKGGILWRLAVETLRPVIELPDCSSGTLEDNFTRGREVELITSLGPRYYMESFLNDYTIRLICGTYVDHGSKSSLSLCYFYLLITFLFSRGGHERHTRLVVAYASCLESIRF